MRLLSLNIRHINIFIILIIFFSNVLELNGQVCSLTDVPVNLRNGLVTFFPFCNNFDDKSTTPSNLIINKVTLGTDRFGNANSAAQFSRGNSSYLFIPADSKFEPFSFTISLWFKTNLILKGGGPGQKDQNILSYSPIDWSDANAAYGIELPTENNSRIQTGMWKPIQNQYIITSSGIISNSEWYHIILSYDGETHTQKLYINGLLYASRFADLYYGMAKSGICIGSTNATSTGDFGAFFDGLIDDVAFWNRPLEDHEVIQLYNNFSSRSTPIASLSLNEKNSIDKEYIRERNNYNKEQLEYVISSYFQNRYVGKIELFTKGFSEILLEDEDDGFVKDTDNEQFKSMKKPDIRIQANKVKRYTKNYQTTSSICYYDEIFDPDSGKNIIGYNVYGAFLAEGKGISGEVPVVGSYIEDPHVIDTKGNLITSDKLLYKTLKAKNGLYGVFYRPKSYIHDFRIYGSLENHSIFNLSKSSVDLHELNPNYSLGKLIVRFDNEEYPLEKISLLELNPNLKPYFIFSKSDCDLNCKGIINDKGDIIAKPIFSEIIFLTNRLGLNYFLVKYGSDDDYKKLGILKSDGNFLYEPNFDEIEIKDYVNNPKNLSIIKYKKLFGLIDRNFNIVVEPIYKSLFILDDFTAVIEREAKSVSFWDLINLKTKKLRGLDSETDIIPFFKYGQKMIPFRRNNKYGYCNANGDVLIYPKYDYVGLFNEGIALVSNFKNDNFIYGINNMQIINSSGNLVAILSDKLVKEMDISYVSTFSDGFAIYKSRSSGLYGYFNNKGESVISPQFEQAFDFRNGKAKVVKYGTTFLIDRSGNRIY